MSQLTARQSRTEDEFQQEKAEATARPAAATKTLNHESPGAAEPHQRQGFQQERAEAAEFPAKTTVDGVRQSWFEQRTTESTSIGNSAFSADSCSNSSVGATIDQQVACNSARKKSARRAQFRDVSSTNDPARLSLRSAGTNPKMQKSTTDEHRWARMGPASVIRAIRGC